MVNAQEWLNKNYSEERKHLIEELYINERDLVGELNLESFTKLRKIYLSHYYADENKLEIKNKQKKVEIIKCVNAQEWLDKNYPKETREKLNTLVISNKNLEGCLDLSSFVNLERLDCSHNRLTNLDLTSLVQLAEIECSDNYLNQFNSSLNADKLVVLHLSDNEFTECDLSVFSKFINLQSLRIGNSEKEKIQQDIYNRFYGSLEPLKDLTKLKYLHISNTDINRGIGHLSDGIREIYYSTKERPESQVKEIGEELASFLDLRAERERDKDWRLKEWEELGFNHQQTEKWLESGLGIEDYHFAAYLRGMDYNPQQNLNWEELKKENKNVQEYLEEQYILEKRKEVTWLDISRKGLEGDLVIENFPNLEKLNCSRNQITSLTLNNLPKLACLYSSRNKLADLIIINCPAIKELYVANNHLDKLEFLNELNPNKLNKLHISNNSFLPEDIAVFRNFVNLTSLHVTNSSFYGSLQTLRRLDKLENFSGADNKMDSDLEYLPDKLNEVALDISEDLKKDTESLKLLSWTDLIKANRNASGSGYYTLPFYDFQHWKETQPLFKWLEEELKKINPNLNVYDVLGNIFFNVKTGDFEGNLQSIVSILKISKSLLEEKDKEIDLLTLRIQELEYLIRKQKEKIVDAYLLFAPERNLLQKLVVAQLEFTKASRQEMDNVIQYRRQRDIYYYELVNKLSKKQINELEIVLKACEEIISWEIELEKKFNDELLLLEEKKQMTKLDIITNLDKLKKRLWIHMEQKKQAGFIQEKIGQKIKEIEKITVFPTWFNDICAIVINKEKNYNLWMVSYGLAFGKTEERVNCLKIAKLPPIKEKWEEIIEHFKKALNSDYPAAEVLNNIYTFKLPSLVQYYGNIQKEKIKILSQTNPDDYIKPYDIVKVNRKGGLYQHVSIYLGNMKVVHVRKNDGLGVRIGTWEEFLNNENKIEIHHPFIPFKRPELIQKHIDVAVKAKYGKGKYHLFKENCEHFATLCVYGLGISPQSRFTFPNETTKNSNYLLQAIKESNKFFKKMEKEIQDWNDISSETSYVIEISPKK